MRNPDGSRRRKFGIWIVVGFGATVFLGANAHLIYVATVSQSACVSHTRSGDAQNGAFSAAQSSCSP
jgi:hypothetical protein